MKRLLYILLLPALVYGQWWQDEQFSGSSGVGGGGGGASNISYQVDWLDGNSTPEKGDAYTFDRNSTRYFFNAFEENDIDLVTTDNQAVEAFSPVIDAEGGIALNKEAKNWVLQSEAPATTWSQVGSPTSVNNSVGTWGDLSYGSIVAAASGDGIQQSATYTTASNFTVGSVWMAVSSGTLDVDLTLEGDSGGTPETVTHTVKVGEHPRRFYVYNNYSASATGNSRFKIEAKAAGTLLLGGMMLEDTTDTLYANGNMLGYPSSYVKTTTAVANSSTDRVLLPSGAVDMTEGSISMWVKLNTRSNPLDAASGGAQQHVLAGMDGVEFFWGIDQTTTFQNYKFFYNGTVVLEEYEDITPDKWHHLVVTWAHDGSDLTSANYLNGEVSHTDTRTLALATAADFYIGSWGAGSDLGYLSLGGQVSLLKVYNEALDSSAVSDLYDEEITNFDPTKHQYGYPANASNRYEEDVTFQLDFTEASGNVVDEVGSVSLTPSAAVLYQQDTSAYSSDMEYGIHTDGGRKFDAGGAVSAIDIGSTDSAVFEWVVQWPAEPNSGGNTLAYIFSSQSGTTGSGVSIYYYYHATANWGYAICADDATCVGGEWSNPFAGSNPTTTAEWKKMKLVLNRSSHTLDLIANDTSFGTKSVSALSGKAISSSDFNVGGRWDVWRNGDLIFNEFRTSTGTRFNDSGGPRQ